MKRVIRLLIIVCLCVPFNVQAKDTMTLREKISQMIMISMHSYDGKYFTKMTDGIKTQLKKYQFGGIILFRENIKSAKQTATLTKDIQSTAKIPMFIATDQEGGTVYRLTYGCALPGNMAIGATNSKTYAKEAGQLIGEELSAVGINTNFGPVVDLISNPNNPAVGLRSFSDDPTRSASMSQAYIEGLQSQNVISTAKHFCGNGDSATDPHVGLPIVNKSQKQLLATDAYPFIQVKDQTDMIMTAHIAYPKVVTKKITSPKTGKKITPPGTLSKDIVTGILREKIGFKGVIITDSMTMGGVSKNFTQKDAFVRAIKAGNDMILMPTKLSKKSDFKKIDAMIDKVVSEVKKGNIKESRIDASVQRILALKEKRHISKINTNPGIVANTSHRKTERKLAATAVTVIRNKVFPITPKKNMKFLVLTSSSNEKAAIKQAIKRLIKEKVIPSISVEYHNYTSNTTNAKINSYLKGKKYVICTSNVTTNSTMKNYHTKVPVKVINRAKTMNKKSIIISVGLPYDIQKYKKADTVLCVYGNRGVDPTSTLQSQSFQPNLLGGIDVLFGKYKTNASLPVNVKKFTTKYTDTIVYKRGYHK